MSCLTKRAARIVIDQPERARNQRKEVVLIVDDNAANLGALSDLLDRSGYDVAVARDGAMALEQVEHEAPDLILLDVRMPGMDGFEVCRRLKERPSTREIPVMFMTALRMRAEAS